MELWYVGAGFCTPSVVGVIKGSTGKWYDSPRKLYYVSLRTLPPPRRMLPLL